MSYRDRAWCFNTCGNMECDRNTKHIPKDWKGFVDFMFMKDTDMCIGYIEETSVGKEND